MGYWNRYWEQREVIQSFVTSNLHVSDSRTYVFCPASGDNWASTEPNTALVRFQHHTCEEGGIVVLERGELKAP